MSEYLIAKSKQGFELQLVWNDKEIESFSLFDDETSGNCYPRNRELISLDGLRVVREADWAALPLRDKLQDVVEARFSSAQDSYEGENEAINVLVAAIKALDCAKCHVFESVSQWAFPYNGVKETLGYMADLELNLAGFVAELRRAAHRDNIVFSNDDWDVVEELLRNASKEILVDMLGCEADGEYSIKGEFDKSKQLSILESITFDELAIVLGKAGYPVSSIFELGNGQLCICWKCGGYESPQHVSCDSAGSLALQFLRGQFPL